MAGPLNAKALREATPVDQLPYMLERKWGEPRTFAGIGPLRSQVMADMDGLADMAARIGTDADRDRVAALRGRLMTQLVDGLTLIEVDELVDEYTQVRYKARIADRRIERG